MRVVVAGAAGMLGQYVVARLSDNGHQVLGLSRSGARGHQATDYTVASLVPLVIGADAVVDLAATRPGRTGGADAAPPPDLADTVVTGAHLVEATHRAGVPTLVQASSVSVYDPTAARPLTEESPTEPRSAYGVAKLAVELWARTTEAAGLRVVTLRLSHLLGAHDDSGWLVSTYLRRAARDDDLPVHEPLGPARDLLYAGDAARAVELALTTPSARGCFNVAGPRLLTPAQLAQAVSDTIGGRVVGGDPAWRHTPLQPTDQEVSTERARTVLGFRPHHGVRTALLEIREELARDGALRPRR
ncbi:NAD(P)-dependent oxidoreductase [Ornithinimicrobium sp. F0845]|uniref:NAD-dependent epimerase/dehydratase family protein n=1 Tax=Ornithinimicrobium sp. F0845 TaxID=2926412 RepID=UPI001FF6881A|nr:NAD(P)-dependent oxidoreductase [Ornithinimicrobium sp. F0845]